MEERKNRALRQSGLLIGIGTLTVAMSIARQGPPPPPPPAPELEGLTASERASFRDGANAFRIPESVHTGLGPIFNGTSCGECHSAGGLGGAATNLGVARVTRIGAIVNGKYSALEEFGGPVLQARSLNEVLRNYPVRGEIVPRQAQFVVRRLTTPVFGAGLIEAIPQATILARMDHRSGDGIQGVANMVFNPITGRTEVGRFGWKASVSSLDVFSIGAYLFEMGVTTPILPTELPPQGRPLPPGADLVQDPEDGTMKAAKFTAFMRFLSPVRTDPMTGEAIRGERVFEAVRCGSCHTPSMRTGPNPIAALSNKEVRLYSDLLLHKMGTGLADGIEEGLAKGDQFRTAPLWGLSRRPFLLHDGRARTIEQAIMAHGGEATKSVERYRQLRPQDRNALLEFLSSI